MKVNDRNSDGTGTSSSGKAHRQFQDIVLFLISFNGCSSIPHLTEKWNDTKEQD